MSPSFIGSSVISPSVIGYSLGPRRFFYTLSKLYEPSAYNRKFTIFVFVNRTWVDFDLFTNPFQQGVNQRPVKNNELGNGA